MMLISLAHGASMRTRVRDVVTRRHGMSRRPRLQRHVFARFLRENGSAARARLE
jgi:hypothetical protein